MVRINTKPRRRKKLEIENAPDSASNSSLQSDEVFSKQEMMLEATSPSSPPITSLTVYVCHQVTHYPCTVLLFVLIGYVMIGYCCIPDDPVQQRAYWRPVTSSASAVLSVGGFTVNVAMDVHTVVTDGRTEKWKRVLDTLQLFLRESGILEYEWSGTLQSNLLLADIVVLTDIQDQQDPQRRRRDLVLSSSSSSSSSLVTLEDLKLGQHYMRYATSVYGREMIASAELQAYGVTNIYPTDTDAQVIAKHTGLSQSDNGQVWYSDLTPGENLNHDDESLRTIVACDHTAKVVVVSIRGTFSLSGIVVDLAGFCEAFCGGWAHAGFAAAARNTWESVWETVLQEKMKDLPPDYDLVFTGHSMGAGVACLITILLHYTNPRPTALQNRRIRCFAMAPPPVFTPLSAAPEAVANTIAYVQGWDCVPSLSVDAIRRLMHAVSRIDGVMQDHPVWQIAAERYKFGELPLDLIRAYQQDVALRPLEQAPMLFVPARSLIWLEHHRNDDGYRSHALDPQLYADRVLDVKIPDMMMDHMIPAYEAVFEQILTPRPPSLGNSDINRNGHSFLRGTHRRPPDLVGWQKRLQNENVSLKRAL